MSYSLALSNRDSFIRRSLVHLSFGDQLKQIEFDFTQYDHADVHKQLNGLVTHINSLSNWDLVKIIGSSILTFLLIRQHLLVINTLKLLHPATQDFVRGSDYVPIFPKSEQVDSVYFYTEDNVQIEGHVVYSDPLNKNLKNKKSLVVAHGNGEIAAYVLAYALQMAETFDLNVVLYNPRGVCRSLGSTKCTHDAVKDFKAAIKWTLENGPEDRSQIGVFGHSLGGGISSNAIDELIDEKVLEEDELGRYFNSNSFNKLPPMLSGLLSLIVQGLLKIMGQDVLNTERVLENRKVARKVIVLTGTEDNIMTYGRLSEHVKKKGFKMTNDYAFFELPYGHNDTRDKWVNEKSFIDEMRQWV